MKASDRKSESAEAIDRLRVILKPGDTVYTTVKHVSRSGMHRLIDVRTIQDNEPVWLSGYIARAGLFKLDDRREALKVGGCGMDMGFHVVYNLSHALWRDGFGCIGAHCPSNDHSNGDRDRTPHESAQPRPCPGCDGSGTMTRRFLYNEGEAEPCRTCHGKGRLEAGHWHEAGGYALRQRAM